MLFNMAALYRTAIYSEIDRHFDCEWYFSDLKSDIKWMDLSVLKSVTKLKVIFFHSLSWQKGSIKLLKKDADIIFAIGDPFSISLWTILILKKITFNKRKIFLWTHGWYGDESIGKTFIKKLFFSLSDGVFLYGNYAKRIMAKKGCNINNVWVIHNSLDYIRQLELRNSIHKTNVYEKRFGNNLYNIVFIGRLTESKRLDMIIKALDILRKKNIECNLTIIGNGNGMEKPKHLATELEINLWLYGACYDENINASLLAEADLCVSPGNVGLTAIHSLMFGTPVITHNDFSNQGPEFEAIQKGVTGDFFEVGNVDSLAECISNWFDKHPDRDVVRKACYAEIDSSWNPDFQMNVLKKHLHV